METFLYTEKHFTGILSGPTTGRTKVLENFCFSLRHNAVGDEELFELFALDGFLDYELICDGVEGFAVSGAGFAGAGETVIHNF